jgi:hypothetical protein
MQLDAVKWVIKEGFPLIPLPLLPQEKGRGKN